MRKCPPFPVSPNTVAIRLLVNNMWKILIVPPPWSPIDYNPRQSHSRWRQPDLWNKGPSDTDNWSNKLNAYRHALMGPHHQLAMGSVVAWQLLGSAGSCIYSLPLNIPAALTRNSQNWLKFQWRPSIPPKSSRWIRKLWWVRWLWFSSHAMFDDMCNFKLPSPQRIYLHWLHLKVLWWVHWFVSQCLAAPLNSHNCAVLFCSFIIVNAFSSPMLQWNYNSLSPTWSPIFNHVFKLTNATDIIWILNLSN